MWIVETEVFVLFWRVQCVQVIEVKCSKSIGCKKMKNKIFQQNVVVNYYTDDSFYPLDMINCVFDKVNKNTPISNSLWKQNATFYSWSLFFCSRKDELQQWTIEKPLSEAKIKIGTLSLLYKQFRTLIPKNLR